MATRDLFRLAASLLVALPALAAAGAARATVYDISTQDYPYPNGVGDTNTYLNGINDSGTIVGSWNDFDGINSNYYALSGTQGSGTTGNFSTLSSLNTATTQYPSANGISNGGVIVGSSYNPNLQGNASYQGIVLNGSNVIAFNVSDNNGTYATYATGINSSGKIVGYFYNSSGNQQAFTATLSGNSVANITQVANPSGQEVAFEGINNNGLIAASVTNTTSFNTTGAVWNGTTLFTVTDPTLSASTSVDVYGINNANQLVGSYANPTSCNQQGQDIPSRSGSSTAAAGSAAACSTAAR